MKDLAHQRHRLKLQIDQQKSYADQVQNQYERMVVLKHFYSKLYHSFSPFIRNKDINGLQDYFEKYVAPIHREQIQGNIHISRVANELIRNLLDLTSGQASAMENVSLDIDISGEIKIPEHILMDVFEIMSNFIDNALCEISTQKNGLLRIWIDQEGELIFIQVANTLTNGFNINQIYKNQNERSDGRGYGLKRVRELVLQHPDMEHSTFISGMFQEKEILVQLVKISIARGKYSV